jgi:hypothetical protein
VTAGSDLEPERFRRFCDRLRTPDRPRRSVEGGEHAVSRRVHVPNSVPLHFEPGELVVPGKDGLPGGVAKRRGSLRGFDDVIEQHGGDHPVREIGRADRRGGCCLP